MGWLKDFFFGDFEDSKEEVPKQQTAVVETKIKREQPKVNMKRTAERPVNIGQKKRTVATKMVYEYPKGNFRFPVIPDKAQAERVPVVQTRNNTIDKVAQTHTTVETKVVAKEKFTPTDVPSPVFAFHKRPSHFEFDLDDQTSEKPTQERISLITEEVEQFVEEKPEVIEDLNTAVVTEEPVFQKSEEVKEPQVKKTEKTFSQKKTATKSHIPFNVMMVNNDQKDESKEEADSYLAQTEQVVTVPEKKVREEGEQPSSYYLPSLRLLSPPVSSNKDEGWLDYQEELLNETLKNFNVEAHVVNRTQGPSVTRFEVQPEKGVKVSKITNLTDDIKLSLAAKDIRIEAPIPGKSTIGIEIPNPSSRPVMISEIMNTSIFQENHSPLTAALGLDISGAPIVTDLQKMPHGLIAGATGSGKSVCINSLLVSLLYKARPDQLKLLLIDPKMVELAPYNRIPHLVSPVITDAKAATAALKWAVEEMERRYQLFSHTGVRNMERYNQLSEAEGHSGEKLPYILIVIDELADLMMVAPNDVEESISRIAQKARACGIHMIVATQRPSVDVITGLIKANIPTRVSFSVSSSIDSRTILDATGAEKLLGKGDMLFLPSGVSKPVRLQGTFVSDEEIDAVVSHVRNQGEPSYLFVEEELLAKETLREEEDELFDEACDFVMNQKAASTSLLQRHFRIGYNRAARLMETLENYNIVSATNGSKPRDVIITHEQLEKLRNKDTAN
ncbi:DNA translocase FtsK [Listeria sp. ILCC792]|uniref:DNA translocase FtsK n=1 Tax=Listeria sp. ILCC792 TaxID=1918331 RepID=UPI000B59802C|nr:DNA translocase FtsK [Listeria sp. ILCC792]